MVAPPVLLFAAPTFVTPLIFKLGDNAIAHQLPSLSIDLLSTFGRQRSANHLNIPRRWFVGGIQFFISGIE